MDFFAEIFNNFKPSTIFAKKLHRKCSTGLKGRFCTYVTGQFIQRCFRDNVGNLQ